MKKRYPVEIGRAEMEFLGTLNERDRRRFIAFKAMGIRRKPQGRRHHHKKRRKVFSEIVDKVYEARRKVLGGFQGQACQTGPFR